MRFIPLAVLLFLVAGNGASQGQDARELVRLPEPMQEHMLGNMRDHLATLNEIIGDIADSKFDDAAKISEQRLGMSSLSLHGAAHLAPYLPKPMPPEPPNVRFASNSYHSMRRRSVTGRMSNCKIRL